jgi:hypothetical protein
MNSINEEQGTIADRKSGARLDGDRRGWLFGAAQADPVHRHPEPLGAVVLERRCGGGSGTSGGD